MDDGLIKVKVIQAHREPQPTGGFRRRMIGEILEIFRNEFCPNLHRRLRENKKSDRKEAEKAEKAGKKEVAKDGPRT